ncbi:hypothetical protein [Actinoplanes sp. NPDC051851]|uniref:hypothetical protein n=1 Tax=Actinoplanes sp. NPDC051851 TaxID=3154753 RepID=UPI003438E13C
MRIPPGTFSALLMLGSSVMLIPPTLGAATVLLEATTLTSFTAVLASAVLLVSTMLFAVFALLGVLALTRPRPVAEQPSLPAPVVTSRRLVPGMVAVLALLAGCAQPAPSQAAVPAPCESAAPNAVTVSAALVGGRADPSPHRVSVPLGTPVLLGVTSDAAVDVHVHGYDLEYSVEPSAPGCILFVADRAGLFDVEAHPDTLLLQLEVK